MGEDGKVTSSQSMDEIFEECFEWFRCGAGYVDDDIKQELESFFIPKFDNMFSLLSRMGEEDPWASHRDFLLVSSEKLGRYAREYAVVTKVSIDKAIVRLRTETCDATGVGETVRKDRGGWCKVDVD